MAGSSGWRTGRCFEVKVQRSLAEGNMNPSPDGVAENRASANKNEANEQAPVSQENVAKSFWKRASTPKRQQVLQRP